MEEQPKISVIIPVHNEGEHLSLCLDSLLNNLEKQVEIIVVDDGSTDNSLSIAQRYAEANLCIRVIKQEQSGVCAARNNGLSHAVGEFVTFVDGDAYVDEHLLDHYLMLQKQGNYDMIACGIADVPQKDRARQMELDQESMLYNLFDDPYYRDNTYVWNKLYRTSIIKRTNVKFEPQYGHNADRMFNFQYMRHAAKALFNNQGYYHCVVRKDNIVKRDLKQKDFGALAGFERMMYYSRKYSQRLQDAIAKHYCMYALSVYKSEPSMLEEMRMIVEQYHNRLKGMDKMKCQLFLSKPALFAKVF